MKARWFFQRLGRPVLAASVGVTLAVAGLVALGTAQESITQASMRGIFRALTAAYKYALDPDAFTNPDNREEIVTALQALATNADSLNTHGGALDPSFEYMQRSLARDAHDALSRYKNGNYIGARFSLNMMTENCVTCHTKLPATRKFDLGAQFLQSAHIEDMPPLSRVQLEVATRQFNTAMDTYEDILRDPNVTPEDLALNNVFENYLKIAIGSLGDTKRAAMTLQEYARREDVPARLKKEISHWVEALNALDLSEPEGKEMATAQTLVDEAVQNTMSRSDRTYLVEFITSTALVHRYLSTHPTDKLKIADAYYLLGLAESYIARSYWVSETPFLMEEAIREAPKSKTALKALAFLEDYTKSGYAVTPARSIPPDLQINLDELRKLTQQ